MKTRVLGAINMLGLAKRCGRRILQASTSEVYGDPEVHPQPESYRGHVNPIGPRACYDEGKRCAETLFFDYHRQHRRQHPHRAHLQHLRPAHAPERRPRGVRTSSCRRWRRGDHDLRRRQADALVLLRRRPGRGHASRMMNAPDDFIGPVNLGNPGEFTIRELAELVLELTGSKSQDRVPAAAGRRSRRSGGPTSHKLAQLLGWEPKVALEDGLRGDDRLLPQAARQMKPRPNPTRAGALAPLRRTRGRAVLRRRKAAAGDTRLARVGGGGRAMPRYPHDFVQCPACTHVWNRSFRYDAIPYQRNPNRMFNQGGIWKDHLAHTRDMSCSRACRDATVVEIGCGEGHFVRGLAEAHTAGGRFVGFDPNASPEIGRGVEFHPRLFEPLIDMRDDRARRRRDPPRARASDRSGGARRAARVGRAAMRQGRAGCSSKCRASTVCSKRTGSPISSTSTCRISPPHRSRRCWRAPARSSMLDHGYDGEVVYALVRARRRSRSRARNRRNASRAFASDAESSRASDQRAARTRWRKAVWSVAIWGGTGKAAAFIHQFGADATRFPLVVDSDPEKAGTFVPGTGSANRVPRRTQGDARSTS